MIFILHYILLNAGLTGPIILLTLYLQTYSAASLTEIGALLMVLPFVSIFVKPLFCALADRQQAHKAYLAGSLTIMMLGYGSLAIAPFFPDFVANHGRLVFNLDIIGIVVGFSAFGVVWSLGDSLAVNAARKRGVPWGSYRAWATFSWGIFGFLIGQVNETPLLPKYVPSFLVLIISLSLEVILLLVWPNSAFDMSCEQPQQIDENKQVEGKQDKDESPLGEFDPNGTNTDTWPANRSLTGTLNGSAAARVNPRLYGAVANIFMEDLGSSLRNSLKLGKQPKRSGLADILEQHQLQRISGHGETVSNNNSSVTNPNGINAANGQESSGQVKGAAESAANDSSLVEQPPNSAPKRTPPINWSPGSPGGQARPSIANQSMAAAPTNTLGKTALRRAQMALSRLNSLSSATGHAIADELYNGSEFETPLPVGIQQQHQHPHHRQMVMSSLASNTSLSRAAAARALGFDKTSSLYGNSNNNNNSSETSAADGRKRSNYSLNSLDGSQQLRNNSSKMMFNDDSLADSANNSEAANNKSVEDLQFVLLKLIIKRNPDILKYLIMFTLFGILLFVHVTYFFLHVEDLCRQNNYDFSAVMGAMVAAQSISEIFCFLVVVPYYMPRVGRVGSMLTCALVFVVRYAYYGTYFDQLSPYVALSTEFCHGFAYGISYTLITDVATECVDRVDEYLPELVQRQIVPSTINPNELKLPLRATMQGVFSGAFDGLGNGIGALFAGIFLDYYSYVSLWLFCTYLSVAIAIIYPLTEWKTLRRGDSKKALSQ